MRAATAAAGALIALLWLAAGAARATAQTPRVTVDGRVQQPDGRPVAGAAVNIIGVAGVVSDSDGTFRIVSVPAGAATLVIQALGYRTREVQLVLRGDTALAIDLEVDPIRLDPLRTRTFVAVRGRVIDQGTQLAVPGARVLIEPDRRTVSDLAGRFEIDRIAGGLAAGMVVQALGYLPVFRAVLPMNDTTIVFELQPDSVGLRMIEEQVGRLQSRSQGAGYALLTVDRPALTRQRAWTAADVVLERIGRRTSSIVCLFIDEIRITGGNGMDILQSYLAGELQRIEIIHRGAMVRVYTRGFIEKMLREGTELEPIRYIEGLPPVICS